MTQIEIKRGAPIGLRAVVFTLAFLFSFPGIYLIWRNLTEDSDPISLIGTETVSYTHLRAHETPEHRGWPRRREKK